MPMIPREVYDRVEDHLRRRTTAVERAAQRLQDVRQRAYSVSSRAPDAGGGKPSGKSDPVARAALSVERAKEDLRRAMAWADVCSRCDAMLRGTQEGEAGILLYIEGLTQTDAADRLGVDRQTVRRYRDTYICHAALLAAEAGLIHMEDGTDETEKADQ